MIVLSIALGISLVLLAIVSYIAFSYRTKWKTRQDRVKRLGAAQVKGDMCQFLGTLSILNEYEQIITLSTTSAQGSLGVIGVKQDFLEFIEFKSNGSRLSAPEKRIKVLIEQGRVRYVVKDVELPEGLVLNDRVFKASGKN